MSVPSLETILTDDRFFGLTSASSVQRSLCRIAEGLPLAELASCDDVREAVGGNEALAILAPGTFRPRELDVLAAIRSAKSLFVAAHAFWSSQIVNLDTLRAGEVPRYPILSVNTLSAEATFNHLAGTMLNRPLLRALLVGEVGGDYLFIRHPTGRTIEVKVAAGARAGANLVSVWLTGVAFEEYARQAGEGQGFVVNFDEQLRAAAGRVVEGGQILSCGSPWAPVGPAFERHATSFGRPSPDRVVIKAPGPAMNPTWWTPARCEALRTSNPTAYMTDVLAGFADPSSAFIPQSDVNRAKRVDGPSVMPPVAGKRYGAAMDPGTRGNRWTLIVMAQSVDEDGVSRFEVSLAKEWGGSTLRPLSPWRVLQEIKQLIEPYHGLAWVLTDQHSADANRDLGARMGLDVVIRTVIPGNAREGAPNNPNVVHRNDMLETLAGVFATGAISIPNDRTLIGDLLSIRRVLTRTGTTYDLPQSADLRHCDYAPAMALALTPFPTATDAAATARRAEHERRLGFAGMLVAGVEPDRVAAVLALANGARAEDVTESVWQRLAAARPRDESGRQLSGLSPTDADAWNKLLGKER